MLELVGLGFLAGILPVYLGIVIAMFLGRLWSRSSEGYILGLTVGILIYLFFDLMHESVELTGVKDVGSWIVFLGSLLVSIMGLVILEQRQHQYRKTLSRFLSLPYMIALGMGLHNFGEGLAIGLSYAQGQWVLSALLLIGFALHNGTEGFGIIGAAGRSPITWSDAMWLGLVAGAPTCLGTLLSGQDISFYFSIACYSLAAGSLLYVVLALVPIAYTATRRVPVAFGVFSGISLMFLTSIVVALASGIRS